MVWAGDGLANGWVSGWISEDQGASTQNRTL
jgi:hypothetical protein